MSKKSVLALLACLVATHGLYAGLPRKKQARTAYIEGLEALRTVLSDLPKPLAKDWKNPTTGFERAAHVADNLLRYSRQARDKFGDVGTPFLSPYTNFTGELEFYEKHHLEKAETAKKANDKDEAETHQLLAKTYCSELTRVRAAMEKMRQQEKKAEQSRDKLLRYIPALASFQRRSAQLEGLGENERMEVEAKLQKASLAMADNLNQIVCQHASYQAIVEEAYQQLQPPKAKKKPKEKD